MNIEELLLSLKEQGLEKDELLAKLEELLHEGKITEEDMMKAKAMLDQENEDLEREEAFKYLHV